MAITASMVKELRDTTGAGMMDAKKALTETDGDMEAAVDWRKQPRNPAAPQPRALLPLKSKAATVLLSK